MLGRWFALAAAVAVGTVFGGVAWDMDPLAWEMWGEAVEALGLPSFAFGEGTCVRFTAEVTPGSAVSENAFATLGVAIGEDEDNYWTVQLVARPATLGGGHTFELGEKRGGRWPAQQFDKLGGPRKTVRAWRFGETYRMTVELTAERVRGEIRDGAGEVVFTGETALKGKRAVTSGGPMLVQRGIFKGRFAAFAPVGGGARRKAARTFPPYASDSFVPGVVGRRTGFFHVEEIDGRWWVIDPLGRGTVIRGCDGISYEGPHCEALRRNPYGDHNRKAYASPADWERNTLARLKAWGFNMLGNCRSETLFRRGLAHAIPLNLGDQLCKNFDDDELWIGPDLHLPRTAFPNVFHPKFRDYCRYRARAACAPNRDDPWLLGYFLDNELAWNGWKSSDYRGRASASTHVHTNRDGDGGMFDTCLAKKPGHTARRALVAFMEQRYGADWAAKPVPRAAKVAFLEHVAETYFGAMEAAIREADPNHMILGARFDGLRIKDPKVRPEVWWAAGRHCDLVSFNCYPWADLDRNYVRLSPFARSAAVADVFRHFHEIAGKPMLITEWSFPALDSGLPCRFGAGQRFRTQAERTEASELFARTVLALPFMVGYDYFKWVDQTKLGNSAAFPEDSNYGLVNENDEPYGLLTTMFTRLHADVAKWRAAPLPERREAAPDPSCRAEGARAALAASAVAGKRVAFTRQGEAYTVDNGGGCVWRGRVGGRSIIDEVRLDGREIGSFNGMLAVQSASGTRWIKTDRVVSADWSEADGTLTAVASAQEGDVAFDLTFRLTFAAGRPEAVAELVRAVNRGKRPLKVVAVFFRQHAPYEVENPKTADKIRRPCWKDVSRAAWKAADGRSWGAYSPSDSVRTFIYYYDPRTKTAHPDASFVVPDGLTLPPGAAYTPDGDTFMTLVPGK